MLFEAENISGAEKKKNKEKQVIKFVRACSDASLSPRNDREPKTTSVADEIRALDAGLS